MFGAKNPKHKYELCYGYDLRKIEMDSLLKINSLNFNWIVESYSLSGSSVDFFKKNNFINLLAGTDRLMNLIKGGANASQIKIIYQQELEQFKIKKALLNLY